MDLFGTIAGFFRDADLWQVLEVFGVAVGLVYIYLEYKASVWLWLTGIVMPAIYIYVYYRTGFYADMGINVYYLVAGLYGWAYWLGRTAGRKKRIAESGAAAAKGGLPITHTPGKYYLRLLLVTLVCFAAILYILLYHTDSTVPYGDSLTTALSITGLWMLSRKYVEQWLVWIAVDVICCGLYLYKGLTPTGILYGIYAVIAVFGYYKWKRDAATFATAPMQHSNGEK